MKKLLFNPQPYSKAEQAYLKKIQNRPPDFQFGSIESKVSQYARAEKERVEEQTTPSTPEFINNWIHNN